jgi:hypothetical protein
MRGWYSTRSVALCAALAACNADAPQAGPEPSDAGRGDATIGGDAGDAAIGVDASVGQDTGVDGHADAGLDDASAPDAGASDARADQVAEASAAGVVVGAASSPTTEAGGSATFTVVLTSAPTAQVTFGFHSDNPGEGTPTVASLVFAPSTWNVPQTVTVLGKNDLKADGDVAYAIVFDRPVSADPGYAALPAPNPISLKNVDDDTIYRIRTTYSEGGNPFYVTTTSHQTDAGASYHGIIARLGEPSIADAKAYLWNMRPGLADPNDPSLVSFASVLYPDRYWRFDGADPARYPSCDDGATYGWALCKPPLESRTNLLWLDPPAGATFPRDATVRLIHGFNGDPAAVSFQLHRTLTSDGGTDALFVTDQWYQMNGLPQDGSQSLKDQASFTLELVPR